MKCWKQSCFRSNFDLSISITLKHIKAKCRYLYIVWMSIVLWLSLTLRVRLANITAALSFLNFWRKQTELQKRISVIISKSVQNTNYFLPYECVWVSLYHSRWKKVHLQHKYQFLRKRLWMSSDGIVNIAMFSQTSLILRQLYYWYTIWTFSGWQYRLHVGSLLFILALHSPSHAVLMLSTRSQPLGKKSACDGIFLTSTCYNHWWFLSSN